MASAILFSCQAMPIGMSLDAPLWTPAPALAAVLLAGALVAVLRAAGRSCRPGFMSDSIHAATDPAVVTATAATANAMAKPLLQACATHGQPWIVKCMPKQYLPLASLPGDLHHRKGFPSMKNWHWVERDHMQSRITLRSGGTGSASLPGDQGVCRGC